MSETNLIKTMQDRTPEEVSCAKCGAVIIPASRSQAYSERDKRALIIRHKCLAPMEAKRDFEREVR